MKLFSNSNSKLSKDGIWAFGLPAKRTCPNAGDCKKICYASKGFYLMPNVKKAQESRFELTKNLPLFAIVADDQIKKYKISILRIHDSGDFYSDAYLETWFRIMRSNPQTRFYAYTKEVKRLKAARERWPENFTVIFSFGGKQDGLINVAHDRHAMVFDDSVPTPLYADSSYSDLVALNSKNNRIGLVRH
jgi:hypothetical protein